MQKFNRDKSTKTTFKHVTCLKFSDNFPMPITLGISHNIYETSCVFYTHAFGINHVSNENLFQILFITCQTHRKSKKFFWFIRVFIKNSAVENVPKSAMEP